ncbi:hypothetical protein Ahy_B04g073521 [Arachis hypogaea]|uniref:Leucine-rich repeat-containing N-terminal plant-type domain-containing protein n=1 Tax=Arachis hypogaea TaxID=3818 RepID=A0A444ZQK7_ARAHY|nr:hypothetical protein Ahy_B04g073521 [Arachis hypogaea]
MFCAMKKDRNALSAFMQGIEDPHKFLSSRSTEQDCCKWFGVECNNITGNDSTEHPTSELFGAPLLKNCTQEKDHNRSKQKEDRDSDEFGASFLIGMGVGFASCFWVVRSTIFFIKRCRHAYFRMLDNLYIFVVLQDQFSSAHTKMLLSLHLPSPSPSSYHTPSRTFHNKPHYIKFRTSYRQNLRYLQHLTVIPPDSLPDSDTLHRIFATVNLLKSHSLSDSDIPRIAAAAPSLFSPSSAAFSPDNISAVFHFLATDVAASSAESRGLVLRCPHLLLSPHPDLCLRPTLYFLRDEIGLSGLNRPTNRNAHLLNTRVEDLRVRVEFLTEEVGFEYEEACLHKAFKIHGTGSHLSPVNKITATGLVCSVTTSQGRNQFLIYV